MEKRRIGKHGLEVSALCLGTMTFGYQIEESISREILDKAMDHRIVFMDTSDAYPLGGPREIQGEIEAILGRWMKAKGNRDQIVLATKCLISARRLSPHHRLCSRRYRFGAAARARALSQVGPRSGRRNRLSKRCKRRSRRRATPC